MRNKFFFILILVSSFGLSIASAQTTASKPKTVSAGIVNGKAESLPKPEYPAAAQAVKASGEVKVQILIDETGNIVSAAAVSGHPLLRQAAEQAARQSKFKPTLLSGQPVKVSGVIVYNFIAEKSNEEKVEILGLSAGLFLLKNSSSDLERLGKNLETSDPAKEIMESYPNFAKELAPLAKLQTATPEKRPDLIDGVISAVGARLSAEDKWQFELGRNFGEFLAPLFLAMDGERFDFSKLDETSLRMSLGKIKNSFYSAPSDFPADVLDKLKELAEFDEKQRLTKPENLQKLFLKLMSLIETISPGSAK